ncbi:MAG TPA: hypothetical protein PK280_13995 [Planctomycetota bacterium]|nr:hypothetical protein [Planctomycetota bacterium]
MAKLKKSSRVIRPSSRRTIPVKDRPEKRSMESEARRVSMHAVSGGEFLDRLRAHYRECRRKDVDIEAEVQVYLADGTYFDKGTAKVANVSASGALLTNVQLKGESLPTGQFVMHVTMRGGQYNGVTIKCKPVRLVPDRSGLGVRLDDIFVSLSDSEAGR